MKAGQALFFFFFLFLTLPYWLLLSKLTAVSAFDVAELWWAVKNSFLQASLSSLSSLLLASFLVMGLWSLPSRWQKIFEYLCLLPGFLPPLFVLLVVLSVAQPFPTGIVGIVLIHIVMNAGLVTLLLRDLAETKLRPLLELAAVEGASRTQFLRASWGMVRRDLLSIFFFVFALCFCSFSVPLIAGGGRATTLEILIYEKIRISGAWGEAMSLSILQVLLIFIFSLNRLQTRKKLFGRQQSVELLKSRLGLALLLLYSCGFVLVFLFQSFSGWSQLLAIPGLWQEAWDLVPMTFIFSLSVGFLIFVLLMMTAFPSSHQSLHRLISGFASPSTALLGFSLLFFMANEEPWIYLKWILGFSYLVFATLYRWGWDQELTGLQDQVQVSQTLGASQWLIFQEILFPQLLRPASRLAGVAAIWALGDFALGKILVSKDVSLAMLIETLMASYRIEAAMALLSVLLLLGLIIFFLFRGLNYVYRRTAI